MKVARGRIMRKTLTILTMLSLYSCASFNPSQRNPSSSATGPNLSGDHLGVSQYKWGRKGPNRAATRIYFQEIENEPGSYNVVLLEYVNLLRMAPQYIAANKLPIASNVIGYLKNITRKIATFKAVPHVEKEGVYNLYELHIVGERIEPKIVEKPRQLILSKSAKENSPLEGAIITSNGKKNQPKEIFFPAKNDKKDNGVQYHTANFVYKKVGLDSTWRKDYLPGPYFSAYGRKDDVVLKMTTQGTQDQASFIDDPEKATSMSERKRRAMFTNPKSAFLKGDFDVVEPQDGMFLFKSVASDKKTNDEVTQRFGLFIDIFDATKALNQDVVEFTLINPEDPEDFLMYYEDPDNGEGK